MEYETREAFKQMAARVADRLLADLKSKVIPTISIDVIRAELRQETECPRDALAFDRLEEMTTRRIVEKA